MLSNTCLAPFACLGGMVEFRVIKYFLAAVDAGSITEGARRVHVSQPSVSRQLRSLEKELGVLLFERGQGSVRLTHAGRRFEKVARELELRERLAHRAVSLTDVASLRLTIVGSFTTITRVMAPFVAERGGSSPLIDALEETPSRIFDRVVEAEADLGISTLPPPPSWESKPLHAAGLTLQVAPGHPFHGRAHVDIQDLVDLPLILIDRTNAARIVFDEALTAAGLRVRDAIELNSAYLAQAHAAAGRGAAVATNAAAFGLHPVRIMLDGKQVRVHLVAGWDPGHYATPVISRWLEEFSAWLPGVPDLTPMDL